MLYADMDHSGWHWYCHLPYYYYCFLFQVYGPHCILFTLSFEPKTKIALKYNNIKKQPGLFHHQYTNACPIKRDGLQQLVGIWL
jgi:hypothetical protein